MPQRLVPSGFVVQPDGSNRTGPTDLNKAVTDDGEKDAATVLKQDGFRRGYQRLWAHQDGRKVIALVYEFCSVGGAKAYATRAADAGQQQHDIPLHRVGDPRRRRDQLPRQPGPLRQPWSRPRPAAT